MQKRKMGCIKIALHRLRPIAFDTLLHYVAARIIDEIKL